MDEKRNSERPAPEKLKASEEEIEDLEAPAETQENVAGGTIGASRINIDAEVG